MFKKVLFFDSGIGGLSVYDEVRIANPGLEISFLFDNEFFPYGQRTEDFLVRRISSLLTQAVEQIGPSALVVACNTASTIALPSLRQKLEIPVIGVVPAIKPAAAMSRKKIIGLLATPGTVNRDYTQDLINSFASDCKVIKVGEPDLATVAERKMMTGDTDESAVMKALLPFLRLDKRDAPDVIVLGCTHYPLLLKEMQAILPEVRFIDSGEAIGRRVADLLSRPGVKCFPGLPAENVAYYTGELANPEAKALLFRRYGFTDLRKMLINFNNQKI